MLARLDGVVYCTTPVEISLAGNVGTFDDSVDFRGRVI